MKLEKLSDDNIIVFLNKFYIDKLNFSIDKNLDDNLKKLFKIISDHYDLDIIGYYNILLYQDKIYGYIFDIERENIDFYSYYDDHIDMKISISKNSRFLFKLKQNSVISNRLLKYVYLIKNGENLYLLPKKTISQYDLGYIVENTKIVYGSESNMVLDCGKYINTRNIFV